MTNKYTGGGSGGGGGGRNTLCVFSGSIKRREGC
jgi:hypothetical protein